MTIKQILAGITRNKISLPHTLPSKKIECRDYLFNKGDIFLLDRDITHTEYLYYKNMAVIFLQIGNSFFDKSMRHDMTEQKTKDFLGQFVLDGNKNINLYALSTGG